MGKSSADNSLRKRRAPPPPDSDDEEVEYIPEKPDNMSQEDWDIMMAFNEECPPDTWLKIKPEGDKTFYDMSAAEVAAIMKKVKRELKKHREAKAEAKPDDNNSGSEKGEEAKEGGEEGDEEGDEEGGEEGGEEGAGEEDEEDEEDEALPPVEVPVAEHVPAPQQLTFEDMTEPRFVVYGVHVFGAPDTHLVLKGEPIAFDTVEEMNALLNTKSDKGFEDVMTKHIYIYRSNRKLKPADWYEGKPGAPTLEELPYEHFWYIVCYVKGHEAEAHDRRRIRTINKGTCEKLRQRFNKLKKAQKQVGEPGDEDYKPEHSQRKTIALILDWEMPEDNPQVDPKVADWWLYRKLNINTAFKRRVSAPRPKGPQSKGARSSDGEVAEAPPGAVAQAPVSKRLRAEAEAGSSTDSHAVECAPSLFKRVRRVRIDDPAKTHVFIDGNSVVIIESGAAH